MKLLMIMVDSNHQKDVERILDAHDVPGYTELPNVLGKGVSGR
ncbi:MAG: P-II family nitrogen regulator, partial [Gemmatimonadales bacterium]